MSACRIGRMIALMTCGSRYVRHVRMEVVQVESGRESEVLNLRPPIIAALSHSSEMRLKNGARKRLSRRYLEYSSHLSQSIRDEFASYERRLVIDTLVQNTIDSQQDGGRQHSLLANERKTRIVWGD